MSDNNEKRDDLCQHQIAVGIERAELIQHFTIAQGTVRAGPKRVVKPYPVSLGQIKIGHLVGARSEEHTSELQSR